MPVYLPNGIGETTGDVLSTVRPLQMTGNVWYCDFVNGADAASPRGQNRERPLKTLSQAITNAADNDIIVLLASETFTAGVTVNKRVTIIGSGSSGGRPVVQLIPNFAATTLLTVTVSNVQLRNLWLDENQQANASARVIVNAAAIRFLMRACYVECGANDTGPALTLGSGVTDVILENSTFISTATSSAAQPATAVSFTGTATDVDISGCVFSGGTAGFSNYRALDASAGAVTRLRAVNVSLLLGADWTLNASTTGYVHVGTSSGGARLDW